MAPSCQCSDFYEGDGITCTDIDECADGNNGGCDVEATCTNNIGAAPSCQCNDFYEGDGITCSDIDECADGNNGGCDANATCTNNIGVAPSCLCNDLYEGDGIICTDVDECADGNNGGCDADATCTNNVGAAPSCQCNQFFLGDGLTCERVDPNPVNYCAVQFPLTVSVLQNTPVTIYGRLSEPGLTDRSAGNDADPRIRVQFGYGPRASDPQGLDWIWTDAQPNPNYDGNNAGVPNNDEYMTELSLDELGAYSYAFRVTVDLEQTWVYCDRDGAGTNLGGAPDYAFLPDQSGELDIVCPEGFVDLDGACVSPFSEAEAQSLINNECSLCHSTNSWFRNFPTDAINAPTNRGEVYITPGDYASSYLWMKIAGAPGISGSRMPTNGFLISADIDRFAAWIQELP